MPNTNAEARRVTKIINKILKKHGVKIYGEKVKAVLFAK